MKTTLASLAALLAVVPLALGSTQLRPGSLDPTFGKNGKATTSIGVVSGAKAVAIQPDGRIVLAGFAYYSDGEEAPSYFALARYRANGSLDSSFGGTYSFGGTNDAADALALQPDGKIVAGGVVGGAGFALVRFRRDGSLDTSFGSGGVVTADAPGYLAGITRQPDGKIVAAGFGGGDAAGFLLARYNSDGSPDTSFGADGIVRTAFGSSGGGASAVALQPDGKIVAVGSIGGAPGRSRIALARYNTDGSLDGGFGTGGKVITDVGASQDANAVVLQSDGKIVVAGDVELGGYSRILLLRYRGDGSLDPIFGKAGVVTTPVDAHDVAATAVALQADGKIVAAAGYGQSVLVRYEPDGSLDQTFGQGGQVPAAAGALGLAIQGDGKLVGVGGGFAVARYLSGNERCVVPNVVGKRLVKARRAIRYAYCSVGRITRAFSPRVKAGRVIGQGPRAGRRRPLGAKVNLLVSKGKRR